MVTALFKRRCQFQGAWNQSLWNHNRHLNGACSVAGMAGSHNRESVFLGSVRFKLGFLLRR